MTYSEALREAEERFKAAGIEEYKNDALLLMRYAADKDRTFLLTRADEEMKEPEALRFEKAVERRVSREPLQLITGSQDFMGFDFMVSGEVLIPRLDTEFLTEEVLKELHDGSRLLDMCCGSGCILISLCRLTNDTYGVAADISEAALELTRKNAERLGADIKLVKSDLFDSVEGEFEYIVCNPPYIKSAEIDGLMEEVRLFEPRSALDGGEDGLDFYRRIAKEAGAHLCGGGMLFLEIGYDQGADVKAILEEAGFEHVEVIKDYSGNERVVRCLKGLGT